MKKGSKKQFCPRGHNTFIYGRYHNGKGTCKQCSKEDHPGKRGGQTKRFCVNGHDTWECGRTKNNGTGNCRICMNKAVEARFKGLKDGIVSKPKAQFCPKGHDTFVVGRNVLGYCNQCCFIRQRHDPSVDSRFKQFCPEGHDKNILGRETDGSCTACHKVSHKLWRKNHPEYLSEYFRNNLSAKIAFNLRGRIRRAIKNNAKAGSAVKDLSCTIEFLKKYIESMFYNGMTWDNWGTVWELDHIIALFKFDLTDRKQFLKAVHYTNLQPLTIEDHRKKTAQDLKKRINPC